MKRTVLVLGALAAGALAAPSLRGQPQAPVKPPGQAASTEHAEERKGIQALTDSFVAAYNKADAKTLALMFKEDAEIIDVDGERFEGRDAIEKGFADTFANSPGIKMTVTPELLRFPGSDTAKEEGRSTVTMKDGTSETRRYTVLYTRRGGKWLYDSVREDTEPLVSPHERLKALEWLLGDWIDESADAEVRLGCKWSEDGNYLLRDFTLRRHGRVVMKVSQRIGWDPLTSQFKSWEFDSEGGYGEALWTQDGNRWLIKQTGVRPDGRTASATRILVQESPNRASWVSTQEVVGGEAMPDSDVFVMVKPPPSPHGRAEAGARTNTPARKPQ